MKLVIASRNNGKLKEFEQLLMHLPLQLVSLNDYPGFPEVEETGSTFAENAAIKAETVARLTGELVLADDSGLEVDALGGQPGVYSARFAGVGQDDVANNQKLLHELADVASDQRTARFRCVIAIARPGMKTQFAEGTIEGKITYEPQGTAGFGYDPLFFVTEANSTFAEMASTQKNKISHRALAMANAMEILEQITAGTG